MHIFDSHLHLNHPDFLDQEKQAWREANLSGVNKATVIGYDLDSSRRAIQLAEELPEIYASVGVSPHDIMAAPDGYLDDLRRLASHPKVVAIGECGLEYHYPAGPKEIQIKHFTGQIQLAKETGKTVVIHLREADGDFLNILQTNPPESAILHCFTATQEVMETSVRLGYYISFSGIVTFKNARDLHQTAPLVPIDNLLIETDSPYLAPVPFRGKRCEPKMILETAQKIADLRGMDINIICQKTYANAMRVFNIKE